jgi:16S rRNA processing protein RimM
MTDRIVLAKIADVHGIKGLVKIFPFGEDITLLESVDRVYAEEKPVKITLKNQLGKFILAEIDGIHTREDAEKLKGQELSIDKDALPALDHEEDGYYHHDLIGLKVLNEAGEEIGSVVAVDNYGAGDLLEIRKSSGEKFLIPFTDDYVPDVNIANGTVTIVEMKEL